MLKGDSSGSARLAAADDRINRALANAVERHATKDPGMRGILKRASVVCRLGRKLRKDTEQDSTPYPSVSHGGSSASGTQPSITTSTNQNTGGPTQDVTQARSSDDIGDDVVMREDNADENSAEPSSSSGSDSRRRITTKRQQREASVAQASVTEQHISRKTKQTERPVAVTAQEALDGCRE